jgi:ceramide glucosyltransferase
MIFFCIALELAHLLFWFGGLRLAHLFRHAARQQDRPVARIIGPIPRAETGPARTLPEGGRSDDHLDSLRIRLPVTIFRPLKPDTFKLRPRLQSFLDQLTPGDEVLFGVSPDQTRESDICRSLFKTQIRVDLLQCEPGRFPNPKVNKLAQMQAHAGHDTWILLDSEVAPTARFLGELLRHSSPTTAITAMYRFTGISSSSELADAVATQHFLWIGTLWRRCLANQEHLFGACMVVRRSMIEQIGGFPRLGNYLADDYHLGHALHQAGFKIELAAEPIDVDMDRLSWGDYFSHQLRTACTYRTSTPAGYFGSLLAQALPAVVAGLLASWQIGVFVLLTSALLRAIVHSLIERTLGGKTSLGRILLITPVVLGMESIVWLASWFLPGIRWGDRKIALHRDGRIRS